MADPNDPECRRASAAVLDDALRAWLPVDEEGLLVNAIVEAVETEPDIGQLAQVCQRFAITERSLQRLLRRRIGLSPKWLIQRRRLHEASERLRSGPGDLAGVAHDLGLGVALLAGPHPAIQHIGHGLHGAPSPPWRPALKACRQPSRAHGIPVDDILDSTAAVDNRQPKTAQTLRRY